MRFIAKGGEPRALTDWKLANKNTPENLNYNGGGFPRDAVKNALLVEQGYLCAYTMKAIASRDGCHIEHIIAQSVGAEGREDIDYGNMLACFPPSNSTIECPYGAKHKDDYDVVNQPFLSPLNQSVRYVFRFLDDGIVEGKNDVAVASIEVLNLNCAALRNDRAAAINGFLLRRNKKVLSAAEARRLAAQVVIPNAEGRLPAFCEAVSQAAVRYAEKEERKAARLRGVRR
ncbi:hypothetical protein [Paraburkholderia phenazinium]|uniref:TIGR02646 family protein n=1 Tax=Paraburkholderia phenazinium TaxID=60549 RepID=A0A1N6KRF9_9BURK|nr:hypothetical protein [Paraburkholderia phenazinium]SIO58947.1 TIGR02646 family protein [Paraburkholderia phenazinium]